MNVSDKSRLTHYEWERERRNSKRLYMKERECYNDKIQYMFSLMKDVLLDVFIVLFYEDC